MLKIEEIEKKKLIAYTVIIAAVFAGIGFFIYKNYSLIDQNNPAEFDSIFSAGEEDYLEVKNNKSGYLLGGDIFNDQKFRALQDNSITRTSKINIGRENPFEPY